MAHSLPEKSAGALTPLCSHSAKAYGRHSCIYQDPIDQHHQ